MTYANYLHLTSVLTAQQPLTPPSEQDLHDSERLFIVVHQASETLLSQALTDLRHIISGRCQNGCHPFRAERAAHLIDAVSKHLTLMRQTLRKEEFLAFRGGFGTASGAQSAQFRELFALVRHPALEPFEAPRAAALRWQETHLSLVEHMIGDLPGSGDTAGVRFLKERLHRRQAADACPGRQPADACPGRPS